MVFIVGEIPDENGNKAKRPVGTGFIVGYPSLSDPTRSTVYVVTSAHGLCSDGKWWIRVKAADGGTQDIDVAEWFFHPTEDVAVTSVPLPVDAPWRKIDLAVFYDKWTNDNARPNLGDTVYFIGLLAHLPAMAEANIPMVRSGTLGRLYQERRSRSDKRAIRSRRSQVI
ncbi:MAG: hypothetical protein JJE05_11505 [Actinobacteria bacterium]|nr:hypothetical protein [Actinomycetota bacterium]